MDDRQWRPSAANLKFVGVDLNLWPTVNIAVIMLTRTENESNQSYRSLETSDMFRHSPVSTIWQWHNIGLKRARCRIIGTIFNALMYIPHTHCSRFSIKSNASHRYPSPTDVLHGSIVFESAQSKQNSYRTWNHHRLPSLLLDPMKHCCALSLKTSPQWQVSIDRRKWK